MVIESGADPMISVFFVVGGLLMLILAIAYLRSKDKILKLFGLGVLLDAVAFALWAYMSIFRPENIEAITGFGVLVFVASFAVYGMVILSTLRGMVRVVSTVVTALLLATLLVMRFVYIKSSPGFLDSGLFTFGVQPAVMYIYVVISSFTILPAAYVVADKVKSAGLKTLIQFGFTIIVIGITVLLTSENRELQTINGYGMIAGLLLATGAQVKHELMPAPAAKTKKLKK